MRALIYLNSKINIIYPAYTTKLSFYARKVDVGAQKINRSHLDNFKIVIADYLVKNKLERVQFFQKTFFGANIGLEVILKISFLTFSKANIWFAEQKFVEKTYTAAKTLPIIGQVEIIRNEKFIVAVLDANNKIFIVHIVTLEELKIMPIYPFC